VALIAVDGILFGSGPLGESSTTCGDDKVTLKYLNKLS